MMRPREATGTRMSFHRHHIQASFSMYKIQCHNLRNFFWSHCMLLTVLLCNFKTGGFFKIQFNTLEQDFIKPTGCLVFLSA